MIDSASGEQKRLLLYCQNRAGTYRVLVGGTWLPARLRPFLDADLETPPLLLDFDYLDQILKSRAVACSIQHTPHGDVQIAATGDAARAVAHWLGSALSSVVLSRTPSSGG